jgi:hypothetical protein
VTQQKWLFAVWLAVLVAGVVVFMVVGAMHA